VPGGRKPRLLQEDASERIGGMVGDSIARRLASAHGGVEKRQDVFQAAHRPMPSLNRAAMRLRDDAARRFSLCSALQPLHCTE
jgi:hypothetical protein